MDEVVEMQCGLTVERGSATTEHCKLYYRNGVLEAAEILTANESTLQSLLGGTAYLDPNGTLYRITGVQKMAKTAFVRLALPPWVG
jgi:hypothetical protein